MTTIEVGGRRVDVASDDPDFVAFVKAALEEGVERHGLCVVTPGCGGGDDEFDAEYAGTTVRVYLRG